MIITSDPADQRVVVMAQRRCLDAGNQCVPGGFTRWAVQHWDQFTSNTRVSMMRDAIDSVIDSPVECDEWDRYVSVCLNKMDALERRDLHQLLDADGRATMARLFTSCGKCGYAHHLCLCGVVE